VTARLAIVGKRHNNEDKEKVGFDEW